MTHDISPVTGQLTPLQEAAKSHGSRPIEIARHTPRAPLPAIDIVLYPTDDTRVIDWMRVTQAVNDAILKTLTAKDDALGRFVQ